MKNYLIIILIAFGGLFWGCQKANQYKDMLYFTGTETTPETKLTIDSPSSIGVSVTSSTQVDNNVSIDIEMAPDLVASYNKLTGKNYAFPPDGSYSLSTTNVAITSGTNVSAQAAFSITSLANFVEGTTYCVPITISKVSGGMNVLDASRTIYIIINRTIITQAATIAPNYFTVPSFQTDATLKSMAAVTMECRVYCIAFQTKNPYISSIMGIEENFLLRFGDVSVPNNALELAGGLINTKKYPVNSNTLFSAGKWYHVAAVYDGTTISLFVNGVLDSYTDAESGGINLSDNYLGGFHVGYSSDGRLLTGYVSEARVWSRALTGIEMQNNLCYVDPTSKGLVAYWRFNSADANGNVTDLTGLGHTAVAFKQPIVWVPGVRCPY